MPTTSPDPATILRRDREAADRFAERAGKERLRPALERAQRDLEARLQKVEASKLGKESFSAAQLRATLEQVKAVLRPLQVAMHGQVLAAGDEAADMAASSTVRYLRAADEKYRGVGTSRLALDEAALHERAVSGTHASILRRIAEDPTHPARAGVLARYGLGVIEHFERELQQRYVAKTPWEDVKRKLVEGSPFLQGAPAHWAERILRTESMHAANRSAWESMQAADEELGDMCKILSSTFDDRTGADSIAVHGEIRRPNEAFDTWFGSFQHPPDRPNDRAVVVPHRVSWPIPEELEPRGDGEVLARWKLEGRKGSPPARPRMSTIDRKLFGKQAPPPIHQAPQLPPYVEPPPGPQADQPKHPLLDPFGHVAWKKGDHAFAGQELNGVPLLPASPPDWKHVPDADVGEGQLSPHGKKVSTGLVMVEPDGRVWVVEPKDHFGGYEHTWPKGQHSKGLTPQQNALKEAYEETGLLAQVTGLLGDFESETGAKTRYYVARRTAGMPSEAGWESQAVKLLAPEDAAKLLNKKRDKDVLAKLTEHLAAHPELLDPTYSPPAAPAKPKTVADVVLGEKTAPAKGSNEGGFYTGTDGVPRYVKVYKDPAQAHGEHLANALYGELGHVAPKSQVFEHEGRTHYASDIVDGLERFDPKSKKHAKALFKGFAADVLLGNWDVVGAAFDNVAIKGGEVVRLDNGGSLLHRAQGARKPDAALKGIGELSTFFDESVNPSFAKVAKAAGYESFADVPGFAAQVKRIQDLAKKAGGWDAYVRSASPDLDEADRTKVVAMLTERAKLLGEVVKKAAAEKKAAKAKAAIPPAPTSADALRVYGPDSQAHMAQVRKKIEECEADPNESKRFYGAVYKRAGLTPTQLMEARSAVRSWTAGYKDSATQRQVYASFAEAMKETQGRTAPGEKSTAAAVKVAVATRRERWAAVMAEHGLPAQAPDYFAISRGVKGKDFIRAVAESWADDTKTTVTVAHEAAASWSFDPAVSKRYAGSEGVQVHWRQCPIGNTIWDQVTDDSTFVSTYGPKGAHEAEIVAGPGHDRGLELPKEHHVVQYAGRSWTYEQKDELLSKLRQDGVLKSTPAQIAAAKKAEEEKQAAINEEAKADPKVQAVLFKVMSNALTDAKTEADVVEAMKKGWPSLADSIDPAAILKLAKEKYGAPSPSPSPSPTFEDKLLELAKQKGITKQNDFYDLAYDEFGPSDAVAAKATIAWPKYKAMISKA